MTEQPVARVHGDPEDAQVWWFIESDDSDGPRERLGTEPDVSVAHLDLSARIRAQPKIRREWWATSFLDLSRRDRQDAVIRYRARLAFTVFRSYRGTGLEDEDLVSIALLALVECTVEPRDLRLLSDETWVAARMRAALSAAVGSRESITYVGVTPIELSLADLPGTAPIA